MIARFHKSIYWDDSFDDEVRSILRNNKNIIISQHLRDYIEANVSWQRNYSYNDFFDIHKYMSGYIFEVEVDYDYKVDKFAIRIPYNDRFDLVSVFKVIRGGLLVVTAWLNNKNDVHRTLNSDKYVKGVK